ncbi:YcdB/YcdC domain-containing protein [Bacillus sp. JJ722]|uniref:YcdB/YcdC domain-containing protein n=1 Tax=Bacillus sp. JJ722 TaxID=3122973 RepID=UPI002FFF6F17
MKLNELRKNAIEIGNVPSNFVLTIEEIREDRGFFVWKHPEEEERYITLEMKEGQLHKYSTSIRSENHSSLSEVELKTMALQYAHSHIPSEDLDKFALENWESLKRGNYRLTYTQFHNQLPLPFTGFYITIDKGGNITSFRYYGIANDIRLPNQALDLTFVKEKYIEGLKMELSIKTLFRDFYKNGDNRLRLVYEPNWTICYNPTKGIIEKQEIDKDIADRLVNISKPHIIEPKTISEFINLNKEEYTKIREADMDTYIGEVWRHKKTSLPPKKDLSINSFFEDQNNGTLKLMLHPQTKEIKSAYSFIDQIGELNLTYDECQNIAEQLLFTVYPNANQYFKLVTSKGEDEQEDNLCRFRYRLVYENILVEYNVFAISVNRTTGFVDHFSSCDIELDTLDELETAPTISETEAKELLIKKLDIEAKWNQFYDENKKEYYVLDYEPIFPMLEGELVAIDAQTKEEIIKKQL